ncbi:MAG: hypothetical protein J0H53_00260 [Rhizobiales bacterium]|nr:hypothetical protein [Hyphomicrobiales bacterium]
MTVELPPEVLEIGARFYAKRMYLVMTRPARPDIDLRPYLVEHLHHQLDLEKRGILFAAGPIITEAGGFPGTGLFILRAKDFEEARAIADSDPMHKSGRRVYDLYEWRMHEGRISLSINLSDSTVELA